MMRIVCGTDFTPNGHDAGWVAAAWSRRLGGTLNLMHVVERPAVKSIDEELWQGYLAPFLSELEAQAGRLRESGADVHPVLKVGHVADELTAFAQERKAGLVVVSSVGHIAVSRLLVGSTAERIAESAVLPTLTVRRPAPLIAWGEGRRPLKVLVMIDFTASAEAALRWIRDCEAASDWDITLGYVGWPAREQRRFGWGTDLDGRTEAELLAALERQLKDFGHRWLGHDRFRTVVVSTWGKAAIRAVELAGELEVELIVSGTHQVQGVQRLWHQSFSRALLHDSPTNVLLVPVQGSEQSLEEVVRFHRVLVSTDFSDLGNRAIAAALAAVDPGGVLRVVHVVPPVVAANTIDEGADAVRNQQKERFEAERVALEQRLEALIPKGGQADAVDVEVAVLPATDTAQALCQEAERFGAHLICLASHGKSGVAQTLFGSVSGGVLRRSRRPVLIVRPPEP
jgi:nucleotide-binding universal stress UspA family protein